MEVFEENQRSDKKCLCTGANSSYEQIDTATWRWFNHARSLNLPVSGPFIQQKALNYAKRQNVSDFKASNGWLGRFKARHSISCAVISGERASVDVQLVDEWKEKLPTIIDGYAPKGIYNRDETGLFYRALPDRTLCVKREECTGGKKAKERITFALCVNPIGEYKRPLVIGRAAKPRCFRNLGNDRLPVIWKFNKKTWMTTVLFDDWLRGFNKKMKSQKRNVVLILDNAPDHPRRDVKAHYKTRLLRAALGKIGSAKSVAEVQKSVNVLDACHWAASAVKAVKATTVEKFFAKCGISGCWKSAYRRCRWRWCAPDPS